MRRYSIIEEKRPREIVLLKGKPCIYGKCAFCDYINDNSTSEAEIDNLNYCVLKNVTGIFNALEVINSGSVFELTKGTLNRLKEISIDKKINTLYFESSYFYKDRLNEIRNFFNQNIIFKCGIETFDEHFRNTVLNKKIYLKAPEEAAKYFESICLLVGIDGQTSEMINRDIEILLKHFKFGCINIFQSNTTKVKSDPVLIEWFKHKYGYLENFPNIDILWNNTDFGVGSI